MANILTTDEVRKAIYQDQDFDVAELERLSVVASSFLKRKTGYDFAEVPAGEEIESLAIEAGKMYVKQLYFSGQDYNQKFDYSFGLTSLLIDLEIIGKEKLEAEAE